MMPARPSEPALLGLARRLRPPWDPRGAPRGGDLLRAALYLRGDDRPFHGCGHEALRALCQLIADSQKEHQILLQPGGQAVSRFAQRLRRTSALVRLGRVVELRWPGDGPAPGQTALFQESLARALSAAPGELSAALQRRLQRQRLIVLHPVLRDHFEEDGLVRYYTDWLPQLLSQLQVPHGLQLVQPIEWADVHPMERAAALVQRLLWPAETALGRRAAGRLRARRWLKRLRERERRTLKVRLLPELPLTERGA